VVDAVEQRNKIMEKTKKVEINHPRK